MSAVPSAPEDPPRYEFSTRGFLPVLNQWFSRNVEQTSISNIAQVDNANLATNHGTINQVTINQVIINHTHTTIHQICGRLEDDGTDTSTVAPAPTKEEIFFALPVSETLSLCHVPPSVVTPTPRILSGPPALNRCPETPEMAPRRPQIDPVLENGRDTDIVIPVMGPTKAGKSTFLNQLLGTPTFQVGVRLASCTEVVASHAVARAPQEYPQLNKFLNGRRIVLVDTPGFDNTYMRDEEVLSRISEWLVKSYKKGMLVGGVLYLHDMSRDGFSRSILRNITLFTKICGRDAMEQVALVTTKWDRLRDINEGNERVTGLSEDCWRENLQHGAQIFHVQPQNIDSRHSSLHRKPWEIIHQLVVAADTRDLETRILHIQDEMVNDRRFLPETDAGKELGMSLTVRLEAAKELRRRAREDARAGRLTDSLEARQQEIERITAQLKVLRPPGFSSRARRYFGLLNKV